MCELAAARREAPRRGASDRQPRFATGRAWFEERTRGLHGRNAQRMTLLAWVIISSAVRMTFELAS